MNDAELTKSMLSHIGSTSYYPIKRAFGKRLNPCQGNAIDALIAFTKIDDIRGKNPMIQDVEFLVTGLCFYAENPRHKLGTKKIPFEVLLARVTENEPENSTPRTNEIERLLKTKYSLTNGIFHKKFTSLAKRAIPLLRANEIINYEKLLYDLKNWNNEKANVKMEWATSLAYYIKKIKQKKESEEK